MEQFLQVGVITQTHGVRGEVKVFPTTDDPERFLDLKKVLLDAGREKLSLEIKSVKFFKQFVIVKFKEFDNIRIKDNKYLGSFHKFIWPDLDNDYYNEEGSCYALRDHIGILSNGNIVPCCLDTKANIKLGNIFEDDLDLVLKSEKVRDIKEGFGL